MLIKSIRLKNFKGFREVQLSLKPLTVILGPNSAGKSSFGQALMALKKVHERQIEPSLRLGKDASVDFGSYDELVHGGRKGQQVIIGIGLEIGIGLDKNEVQVQFGFGGLTDKMIGVNELDLTFLNVIRPLPEKARYVSKSEDSNSHTKAISLGDQKVPSSDREAYLRQSKREWQKGDDFFKLVFAGLDLTAATTITGTSVDPTEIVPIQNCASALEKVFYLRPDRRAPSRINAISDIENGVEIGAWGEGTAWYIHKNLAEKVESFYFDKPTLDIDEARATAQKYKVKKPKITTLGKAISEWLRRLGLAEKLQTRLEDEAAQEKGVRLEAQIGQNNPPRSLADLGFGISQVLPIIAKGLTVKEREMLIVEQPEAQLHPKPQAELADFFCSMVKCGRNALVETHSENFFHRLRLRATEDPELAEKIAIYFLDEPQKDKETGQLICMEPREISLKEADELKWPDGFLTEGIDMEMQIRAAQRANKR